MTEKDKTENSNIFDEEFDKKDVVNSSSSGELIEDDETVTDLEKPFRSKFLSDEDVRRMTEENTKSKKAVDFLNYFSEEEDESSVIKKKDTAKHDVQDYTTGVGFQDYELKYSKEDADNAVNLDEDNRRELQFKKDSSEDDEVADQSAMLMKEFKDFLTAPRITGKNRRVHGNRIPQENIGDVGSRVELIDDTSDFEDDTHGTTTVEINRTNDGDLESVIVYCKCGERTVIQFDYEDDDDDEEFTEVIKGEPKLKPFANIYNPEFRQDMEELSKDIPHDSAKAPTAELDMPITDKPPASPSNTDKATPDKDKLKIEEKQKDAMAENNDYLDIEDIDATKKKGN